MWISIVKSCRQSMWHVGGGFLCRNGGGGVGGGEGGAAKQANPHRCTPLLQISVNGDRIHMRSIVDI